MHSAETYRLHARELTARYQKIQKLRVRDTDAVDRRQQELNKYVFYCRDLMPEVAFSDSIPESIIALKSAAVAVEREHEQGSC